MKRKFLIIFLALSGFISIFIQLGTFFDISEKPLKSDLIVILGGNNMIRIEKAYALYREQYSNSGKILLTGPEKQTSKIPYGARADYLLKHNVDLKNIIVEHSTTSTYQEICFLKSYMIKNGYQSALIITDPPHTRRVSFVAKNLCDYPKSGLKLHLTAIDLPWWDPKHFYLDETSLKYVVSESIKSLYYILRYSLGSL